MHDNKYSDQNFEERVISIDRVARVVKGGRRFRFRALVVVGDGKGSVGVGVAKGTDVTSSVTKAATHAKKRMIKVPLYKDLTIPFQVLAKFSGSKVMLKPAPAGTGVIAGGAIRDALEVAGVSDVVSKSLGSSNKINTIYATFEAFKQLSQYVAEPTKVVSKNTAKTRVEV